MDFIHDQLACGRRYRCLTLIDDFTRQCLALHVDTSIGGASLVAILERLAFSHRLPNSITDNNRIRPHCSIDRIHPGTFTLNFLNEHGT